MSERFHIHFQLCDEVAGKAQGEMRKLAAISGSAAGNPKSSNWRAGRRGREFREPNRSG